MRPVAYEEEKFGRETVMIGKRARELLPDVDAVVFDCDGVLIDARKSYDSAILRTAEMMVQGFRGPRLSLERDGEGLLQEIRRAGGFNDDWDTTYALTIFSILALGDGVSSRSERSRDGHGALVRLGARVKEFASRDRLHGRASVDSYLRRQSLDTGEIARVRAYVDYPVDAVHTRMTRTFDEMYYGTVLFRRVFRIRASLGLGRGLIEQERVMITSGALAKLRELLGRKIAMSTGRPFVAVQHTMGDLLGYFDPEASMFIGDGDINPKLAGRLRKYKKPSGASLLRACEKLPANTLLYVGDSTEDMLMVREARRTHDRVLFAGVYGATFSGVDQMAYFARNESDVVARSVESIPMLLERTRS